MENETARAVEAARGNPKLDAACKAVLANKPILARIMRDCLGEYADLDPKAVEACIEGEPVVGEAPVLADGGPLIRGRDTEDKTVGEGEARFDILFDAKLPGSAGTLGLMVNIEAQNDFYPGYSLTTRGVFYCGRMIAAQGGREVAGGHYERLKKACSIWICMEPPKYLRGTVARYSIAKSDLIGHPGKAEPVGDYDKLALVMVHLAGPSRDGLLGLLGSLFDEGLSAGEKKRRLVDDFGIPMTAEFERQVDEMCDISVGYWNRGRAEGRAEGQAEAKMNMALNMLAWNEPLDKVIKYSGVSAEEVVQLKARLEGQAGK